MLCENIIRSLKKWEKYTRNKCSYNLMEETNKTFLERKSLDLIILMSFPLGGVFYHFASVRLANPFLPHFDADYFLKYLRTFYATER